MKKMILLGFISTLIFSSEVFGKDTIYVPMFKSEDNTVKREQMLDFRGTFIRNLVEHGGKSHIIQDTDMEDSARDQIKKQQQVTGQSEIKTWDEILKPKEKVHGFLRMNGDKYNLTFKVFLFENGEAKTDKIIEKKNVSDYQMEYYLNEISLAVLNPSYKINDAAAPMRAEHNIKLNSLALSQSDLEIKKVDYGNVKNEIAEKFIETYRSTLQDADTLYAKKKFPESRKAYKNILDAIPSETKQVLSVYVSEIQNRIFNSCKNEFYESISLVDEDFNSAIFKFDMELISSYYWHGYDKTREFEEKYEKTKFYCYELDNSRHSELDKIISSTINDRLSAVTVKGLLTIQVRFHSLWNESRYYEALSIFERLNLIISDIQKKQSTPRIQEFLRKFENREVNLVSNLFVSKAETLERTRSFYDILAAAGKENSAEAESIVYVFGETYELLDNFNRYHTGRKEIIEMIEEAERKAYGTDVYKKHKKVKQEHQENVIHRNSARYFKSKEINSLGLDIALFPFKYIFNISMSILDMFKIEPLVGIGAGTDAIIIHPSIGIGYPQASISTASYPSQKKFIGDLNYEYFGMVVGGENECNGFFIQIYFNNESCKSNSLVRSNTKLNVWGALGVGFHFEINPLAIGNIIPELLVLKPEGRKPFWKFSDTRSFRFNYFSESIPLEDRLEWKQFDGVYGLTESINKCHSIGMELATKDQAEELMNKSKVAKGKTITSNQANSLISSYQYEKDLEKGINYSILCVKEK